MESVPLPIDHKKSTRSLKKSKSPVIRNESPYKSQNRRKKSSENRIQRVKNPLNLIVKTENSNTSINEQSGSKMVENDTQTQKEQNDFWEWLINKIDSIPQPVVENKNKQISVLNRSIKTNEKMDLSFTESANNER